MSEVKDKTKENILEYLEEIEQLVKTKFINTHSTTSIELEKKLAALEEKFQLVNERNKKVYDILNQVITELENLLTNEDTKCQL